MTKQTLFAAAIVAGFAVTGCKKDKDPTNAEKIEGSWVVEEYRINSQVLIPYPDPDFDLDMNFVFDSDGDITQNISSSYYTYTDSYNFPGEWSITDNELDLEFDTNSPAAIEFEASFANYYADNYYQYDEKYQIIELTDTRLELNTIINGRTISIKANKF